MTTSPAINTSATSTPATSTPATSTPATVATQLDLRALAQFAPLLPDRVLTPTELRSLATAVAQASQLWQNLAGAGESGPGRRHFASLHRDSHVDVWALWWDVVDDTGWHDHDISSGAVAVAHGVIEESLLRLGAEPVQRRVAAGRSFSFGPEHIHRITGVENSSVSIHAYSPPLWRLGQYSLSSNGILRRVSVSYADELRPMDEGSTLPA